MRTDRGFTLLEVLIAFVIAALAMGALFSGTVSGLDATAVAAKYDEAISLAKSHMAAIGRGAAIAAQETSGADGEGFTWHLRVREAGSRQLVLSDQDRANDIKPSRAVLSTSWWRRAGRWADARARWCWRRAVSTCARQAAHEAGEPAFLERTRPPVPVGRG